MNNQDERNAELGMERDRELLAAMTIEERIEHWKARGPALVNQLVEYWGCVIGDVETNLEMDDETWSDYCKNPRGYLDDVLGDFTDPTVLKERFGVDLYTRVDYEIHYASWQQVREAALDQYLGVN